MPEGAGLFGPLASLFKGRRGWLVLAALGFVLVALRGATLLFDHSLHSIDGAMQTWFAADNFADGAKLGEEFQSYLGITMILALLPGFMAFGETLWASTVSAYAMVMAGCFAGAYAIIWMLKPVAQKRRWMWALLLIFLFYYVGALMANVIGLPYPATFDPGVSLRPLRGALPFFVLPVFVWALRCILATERARPALVFGLTAGAGLLWSNDAGIPLVIASCIGLGAGLFRDVWLLAKSLVLFALGVAVSAGAVLLLVTHGEPGGWLQYNFIDVPSDQYWYFAPWNREARVLGITDLPSIFMQGQLLSTFSLIVLTASVIIAIARRLAGRGSISRTSAFIFVGSSVVGTALIPQIGGHIGSEYNAITFVLGLCAPLIVFQNALFARIKPLLRLSPRLAVPVLAGVAGAGMIAADGMHFAQTASSTNRTVYAEKLGFYVTPQMAEDLAAIKRFSAELERRGFPRDRRLLSVYTSALDVAAGTKSPAPVGSIIHALGEQNRIDYIEALTGRAVAVTTIAPDYTGWAGWNERANWTFFENLRDLYRPIARNDQHVLWIRSDDASIKEDANCEVSDWGFASFELTITSPRSGIASVFIEREGFDAEPRTALLTVTEDSPFTRAATTPQWSDFPRYGIANARQVEVSAPVEAGEKTRLTLEVLDGSAIGWAECFARVYEPVDYAALPSLSEGIDQLIKEAGQ
ncbi:hypothetical protein EH31_05050 [Erythrobacter longus]|uniref:Uncharacterized protein n=1 Tax=Erythrobacter longus TaxID=1044 RepID=A0A074MB46_ERYLO|nr:hypothetical protein [Erythrobacter longus]KEO92041.1 hypothetical protein EH31_05050 [Erythrobacter longus]